MDDLVGILGAEELELERAQVFQLVDANADHHVGLVDALDGRQSETRHVRLLHLRPI